MFCETRRYLSHRHGLSTSILSIQCLRPAIDSCAPASLHDSLRGHELRHRQRAQIASGAGTKFRRNPERDGYPLDLVTAGIEHMLTAPILLPGRHPLSIWPCPVSRKPASRWKGLTNART
ncbi:MAG TPA: hypothetical protein VME92_11425 [Acetobacteraceae bacterium]|nr:hypothetical protein [Acetobacteraceae bacterium]